MRASVSLPCRKRECAGAYARAGGASRSYAMASCACMRASCACECACAHSFVYVRMCKGASASGLCLCASACVRARAWVCLHARSVASARVLGCVHGCVMVQCIVHERCAGELGSWVSERTYARALGATRMVHCQWEVRDAACGRIGAGAGALQLACVRVCAHICRPGHATSWPGGLNPDPLTVTAARLHWHHDSDVPAGPGDHSYLLRAAALKTNLRYQHCCCF